MKMFDWQEYYLLARELLSQADSSPHKEAMLRSAVSRAYYAAFHRACDYLREVNAYPTQYQFEGNRRETHRFLISTFINNPNHPEWDEIGQMLDALKYFRHKADYVIYVDQHIFKKKRRIEEIIGSAKGIIDRIDSL